jgi:shikimate kinase
LNARAHENVVLVGFMGSGKSSVGRLVARALGGRFVDTDRLVMDRSGREITEIFAREGEDFFRQEESRALRSLLGGSGLVVATGGGIVTAAENVPALRELGFVVWLTASEEVIWERVSRNRKRPLLHTENPRETVRALLEKRNPLYAAVAGMTVDSTGLTHEEVAERICQAVGGGGGGGGPT